MRLEGIKFSEGKEEKLTLEIQNRNSEIIKLEGKIRHLEKELKDHEREKTIMTKDSCLLAENLHMLEDLYKKNFNHQPVIENDNLTESKNKEIQFLNFELENSHKIIENQEKNYEEIEKKCIDYNDIILENQDVIGILKKEMAEMKRNFENMKEVCYYN